MEKSMPQASQKWAAPRNNVATHIAAHPYIYSSLLCHTLLLVLFYSVGSFQLKQQTMAENLSLVESSRQEAIQSDIKRRVQQLEKIKSLLEESVPKEKVALQKPAEPETNNPEKDPSESAQTPAQLMKQARELVATIKAVEDEIKAKELARLLKIPQGEAVKKIAAEAKKNPAGKPENKPAAASLEQLEQQARTALAHREAQLDQKKNGTQVSNASAKFKQGAAEIAAGNGMGNGNRSGMGSTGLGGSGDFANVTGSYSDPRNYSGFLPMPAVSPGLRTASGNSFGAGGQFANRVFVNSWYIIGPFVGAGGAASMDRKYPPEMGVNLDAAYLGNSQRVLKWEYFHAGQYPLVAPVQAENAVYYGYAEINMDQERDLWMAAGADDDAKVWFNKRVVWISGNESKPWYRGGFRGLTDDIAHLNLSESKRKLHFNKGRNTLMFKLYNGCCEQFLSLTLSDEAAN